MSRNNVECPKCESQGAWIKREGPDTWLMCMCGVNRLLHTTLGDISIEHTEPADAKVGLPRKDSKLWQCLVTLAAIAPANVDEITEEINDMFKVSLTNSEVSSQLTVLRYKRLVLATENRKGIAGGSTWICTNPARELLGV